MTKLLRDVYVLTRIPRLCELLEDRLAKTVNSVVALDPARTQTAHLSKAEILVTDPYTAGLWLYDCPNLAFVQGTWAGADSLFKVINPGQLPKLTYCRYGEYFAQPMAEYVVAYVVAQERNIRIQYEAQAESNWTTKAQEHIWFNSRCLSDLTIGILGVGNIGTRVAEACKGLGMTVWGLVTTIPSDDKKSEAVQQYRTTSDLDDVLSSCDYIVNVLPSTVKTRGLLDNDRLSACASKRSVFMNVGRGDICSESTILKALHEKWIRAAILDVFTQEPLPSDSQLWTHPDVTITPHVAAVSTPEKIVEGIAANIERFIDGEQPRYVIDWEKQY